MSDSENVPPVVCGYQLQVCGDAVRENLLRVNSPLCAALKAMVPMLSKIRNKSPQERGEIIAREFVFQLSRLPQQDATLFIFISEQARIKRLLDSGILSFENAMKQEFGRHLSANSKAELFKACSLLFLDRLSSDADKLAQSMN